MKPELRDRGYVACRGLLEPSLARLLWTTLLLHHWRGEAFRDNHIPTAASIAGTASTDALLLELRPRIEEIAGCHLVPTYSYARLYFHGDSLIRHRDRHSCEVSVSIHLGRVGGDGSLCFGADDRVEMDEGDGAVYLGCATDHWREPFAGHTMGQVFLHYVDRDGPYAEHGFDRRPEVPTLGRRRPHGAGGRHHPTVVTGAPRLFVPGYYSGFSNNKMSLDIAIVLAHLTGRVLAPYRFRMPHRHPVDADPDRVPAPSVVPELFDIPVPWTDEHLLTTWISKPDAARREWEPVYESVVCVDDVPPGGDDRFADFRNGRPHVYVVGRALEPGRDLHVTTQGLGNYSTTFFLGDRQRQDVVDLMRRVRPKQPYLDAAARIGAGLGAYNAIHVRRGDFVGNELARRRISRAATINGREIVSNLAARMDRDDPLVICTDGDAGEEIFGPIQQHFRQTVFLDRHLREDPVSGDAVAALPRDGEAVDALVAQLVAAGARTFAGTLFSTFTGLIHRMRGFADPTADVLYCYDDFLSPLVRFERGEFLPVDDGPFSWNRVRYPVSPDAYSWMREWPEAWGGPAPAPTCTAAPADPLDLTAAGAMLTGRALRCVDDVGGRPVLIDWTDPVEHPSWDVQMVAGGTYEVEIRYACPAESAGSTYTVGLRPDQLLVATVHGTGAWTTCSPWLPLGRLDAAAGPATLSVRARDLSAGLAVMNLNGLRLRRVA